jgi:hypothetical protein
MSTQYPATPGWKDPGISRENADRIHRTGTNNIVRSELHELYRTGFKGTADEAAFRLRYSPFQVRPRCTELVKMNVLERTPERRRGSGGGTAAVLRLKQ